MKERRRMPIDLSPKDFNALHKIFSGLRIKSKVFQVIALDLLARLKKMEVYDRKVFLMLLAKGEIECLFVEREKEDETH